MEFSIHILSYLGNGSTGYFGPSEYYRVMFVYGRFMFIRQAANNFRFHKQFYGPISCKVAFLVAAISYAACHYTGIKSPSITLKK